jgi:hypothetical protein
MNNRTIFILVLLLLAAALRVSGLLPLNFSPVAAIALFGGAMFADRAKAIAVPLGIMLLSDVFIGFHDTMWAVYLSLIIIVGLGQLLRSRMTLMNGLVGAVAGSVLFFLITNAAVWINGVIYAPGIGGLLDSYAAGLPFFRNSLMGDLFFAAALFGTYELASVRFPVLVRA